MTGLAEVAEQVDIDPDVADAPSETFPRRAYSPREFAAMIGITYKLALEIIKAGQIGAIRVGREYRIPDHEFELYLRSAQRVVEP